MANQRFMLAAAFIVVGLTGCGGNGSNSTAPVAKAGEDQNVNDGAEVTLDGSASGDADGDTLTFSWKQKGGAAVSLGDNTGKATLTFNAPTTFDQLAQDDGRTLTFELTVDDGKTSAKDSVTVTVLDVTAPLITVSPEGGNLGKTEKVTITFSELVKQDSLLLTGALAEEAELAWHEDAPVLELSPKTADGWSVGADRTLSISIADTAGNTASLDVSYLVSLNFKDFQPADIVIGQPDMSSSGAGTGDARIDEPYGRAWVHADGLYLPDSGNQRVLGFSSMPTENGARADFVIGQGNFEAAMPGTSQTAINGPQGVSIQGNALVVTEYGNNRISVYTPLPTATENAMPGILGAVVGQADFDTAGSGCTASTFNFPEDSMITPDGKLIVTDTSNNRVLVWNTLPTANNMPADLVLGQMDFDQCVGNDSNHNGESNQEDGPTANTMLNPAGTWSDGTKLVVLDSENNRALVWNTFPSSNGQAPDLVLGQPGFGTNGEDNRDEDNDSEGPAANTLDFPYIGVTSNGMQLFIADNENHRVLIWNSWPKENHQPADIVLGQAGFELETAKNDDADDNTPPTTATARTFDFPRGLLVHGNQLIVTDGANYRYLIFNAQ